MRPVHWIGSSIDDLKKFPQAARQHVGFAIYMAQQGGKALHAVPLVGFHGAKVLEILVDHEGNAFRAVYTVKFKEAVYVLHAFQKKSKKGRETPRLEMDLIRERLKKAETHYKKNYLHEKRKDVSA